MKIGKSLQELALELQRQTTAKRDFVVPTTKMEISDDAKHIAFGDHTMEITPLAHKQIAEHAGIPQRYYDRMLSEAPQLLRNNVAEWFTKYPANRLVRGLDGNCRAFLSDRYRPLENWDLMEAVLPPLSDLGIEVMSCDITDTRLYIKAVDQRIKKDIPTGRRLGDGSHVIFDTVSPAITISNSEVGLGRLMVQTSIFTKVCTNLATFGDVSLKKHHVGARAEITDGTYELLSDETRRLTDAALWAQARDVVRAAFNEAKFAALANRMADAAKDRIDDDPIKAVDFTADKYGMNESEKKSILRHLIEGGDLSRYGLFNAVTRTAQDLADYDRSTEFERVGGNIIELSRTEWQDIALAA